MEENVSNNYGLEEWAVLADATSAFVQGLILAKEQAEKRAEALELDVFAWKNASKLKDEELAIIKKAANEELDATSKRLTVMQRDFGLLKDDNPLLYCLIDGDGHIFSGDHLSRGGAGGREAAKLLTEGLTEYISGKAGVDLAGRPKVWVTVYLNKIGLMNTLVSNGICNTEAFNAFLQAFNNASPWFAVVDVGSGKEAADAKIHEHLRVLTRNPQIVQVFFAGGHDNGYANTLNYLQTEGLLDKVTLLRGYEVLGNELRSLQLPELKVDGVFMTEKIQSKSRSKSSVPLTEGRSYQPGDFEVFKTPQHPRTATPETAPTSSQSSHVPKQPLSKLHPRPCTLHYLSHCRDGAKCTHGHNYKLTAEHLLELRANAKNSPCKSLAQGKTCSKGGDCPWGHLCPKGSQCALRAQGKCKFTVDMHNPSQHNRNGRGNHRKT